MASPETTSDSGAHADLAATIIWGALLVSHFMYLGVIYFLHPPASTTSTLVPIITGAAMVSGTTALVIYQLLLGEAQINKWITELKAKGVTGEALEGEVMGRAQSLSIVCWGMAESVTIMGMVLSFTGQQPLERFAFFVAAGVVLHLYCRPKLAEIRKLLGAANDASLFPLSGSK